MSREVTRFKIRNAKGDVVAVHVRVDTSTGKRVWWEQPDGTKGLPDGIGVADLPLFGSELARTIPITDYIVITAGETAAPALRAGGIPALATVTGAATAPTPKALSQVAYANKFILWPDNDSMGRDHMKAVARNLFLAGAREVRIITYDPVTKEAIWPKGFDAADMVTPETARTVLQWLNEDWGSKARRTSAGRAQSRTAKPLITVRGGSPGVSQALLDVFGLSIAPGKSGRCPMHEDRTASLWVTKKDDRAICMAGCAWGKPGVTTADIRAVTRSAP
jgi:hypothetical protein